jgi:hypothetical protein
MDTRWDFEEARLLLSDEITAQRQRQQHDLEVSVDTGHYRPTIDNRVETYLQRIEEGSRILFAISPAEEAGWCDPVRAALKVAIEHASVDAVATEHATQVCVDCRRHHDGSGSGSDNGEGSVECERPECEGPHHDEQHGAPVGPTTWADPEHIFAALATEMFEEGRMVISPRHVDESGRAYSQGTARVPGVLVGISKRKRNNADDGGGDGGDDGGGGGGGGGGGEDFPPLKRIRYGSPDIGDD